MLNFSGHPIIDKLKVNVHGHLTVNNEKMSKSRGTGISPLRYLELGMNPEWLRYYLAFKLNSEGRRPRLHRRRLRRPREQRPDRQVRQHRQPLRRLHRQEVRRQAGGRTVR
jgi:methionyl-tRNA synthetase